MPSFLNNRWKCNSIRKAQNRLIMKGVISLGPVTKYTAAIKVVQNSEEEHEVNSYCVIPQTPF
jgi:hypothetical protein